MGCTCGIWKRFCSLRTSAYSALEVSHLCAIEIHVDIDTDIDMFGCNFPAVEMSMGIFRGSPREICGEKCQWGLSEAIPGKNLTNMRTHTDRHTDSNRCLQGLAPDYLAQYCVLLSDVAARSQLRSADSFQLLTQSTNTVKFGSRAFCSCGPASWNCTSHLCLPFLSLDCFRKHL